MTTLTTASAEGLSTGERDPGTAPSALRVKYLGISIGLILAIIVPLVMPAEVPHEARMTAAVAMLMGTLWITEAVPLAATALLPAILFPALGVADLKEFSGNYMNEIILMFLGGFLLALAMQRWNLHKRIALRIVLLIGTKPNALVAGFMIATAFLSMWVSNTATAMMMIPMAMSMSALVEEQKVIPKKSNFGISLMLGVAYAATIGGLGTLIGSPVNVVIAAYIRESLGYDLTFGQWMAVGTPLMIVMLAIGWFFLTKILWKPESRELPGGRELFSEQLEQLGPMSAGERVVFAIFIAAAVAWVVVPFVFKDTWATDAVIAMIAGLSCLFIPAKPTQGVWTLSWDDAKEIPFDVLFLFGGGLALSSQITASGLSAWMGDSLSGLKNVPVWLMLIVITVTLLGLTEFTSSTATAAAFVPVVGGVAAAIGQDPVVFSVAAGLSCMCAFMMPVGTPPNAIAFGSGAVSIPQMMKTGIWMNLLAIVLIPIVSYFVAPQIF